MVTSTCQSLVHPAMIWVKAQTHWTGALETIHYHHTVDNSPEMKFRLPLCLCHSQATLNYTCMSVSIMSALVYLDVRC